MITKFDENSNFCILGYGDSYSGECVINTKGEVVYVPEKSYNSLYLYGNYCPIKRQLHKTYLHQEYLQ